MVSSISGETLEKAMKELGEIPEKRVEMIEELRSKLMSWEANPDDPHEKDLTLHHRLEDDKFLLRFLRARKFNIKRSAELFVNYFKYRAKHKSMLGELTPDAAASTLKEKIISVLPQRTGDGCKVLVARIGTVDLEVLPLEAILRMLLVILDRLIEDEETQVHGIVFCEDLAALTFFRMLAVIRKEQVTKGMMLELLQVSSVCMWLRDTRILYYHGTPCWSDPMGNNTNVQAYSPPPPHRGISGRGLIIPPGFLIWISMVTCESTL
jgi:retinaldehyde-binding protein 1